MRISRISVTFFVLASMFVGCSDEGGQEATMSKSNVPTLNVIKDYSFSAPYSCGGSYETSGLAVSRYSKSKGDRPELLFNGAGVAASEECSDKTYFESGLAGDDLSVIADLGPISIESVTTLMATRSESPRSQNVVTFQDSVPAVEGHTYSIIKNSDDVRALIVFTVDKLDPNGTTKIRYSVKNYGIQTTLVESDGFDWKSKSKPVE